MINDAAHLHGFECVRRIVIDAHNRRFTWI